MTVSFTKKDLLVFVQIVLLVAILIFVLMLKPWENNRTSDSSDRRITINGLAELTVTPDEFIFYPSFNFSADTNDEILELVSSKSEEVIDGLKDIGVEDSQIEVNANSYEAWYIDDDGATRGNLSLTVRIDSRDKAQEIQDYLLSVSAEGSVTPSSVISKQKQRELEEQGRSAAIADAKAKAERIAADTGVEVGEVIAVKDLGNGGIAFDGPDYFALESAVRGADQQSASIPVQPGEDSFNYSVEVIYEVKQ